MDLSALAKEGILGTLLALSLGANVVLFRMLIALYNQRLEDYKQTQTGVVVTMQEMSKAIGSIPGSFKQITTILKKKVAK